MSSVSQVVFEVWSTRYTEGIRKVMTESSSSYTLLCRSRVNVAVLFMTLGTHQALYHSSFISISGQDSIVMALRTYLKNFPLRSAEAPTANFAIT